MYSRWQSQDGHPIIGECFSMISTFGAYIDRHFLRYQQFSDRQLQPSKKTDGIYVASGGVGPSSLGITVWAVRITWLQIKRLAL